MKKGDYFNQILQSQVDDSKDLIDLAQNYMGELKEEEKLTFLKNIILVMSEKCEEPTNDKIFVGAIFEKALYLTKNLK